MWLFARTSFGRQVRAIAADRETARLYGVPATRLSMLSFGISAALAGLAGLLIGPLGSFDLTLGFTYMLLGFAAAVLGGFGSIGGVVLGGMLIGLTEELFGGQMLPLLSKLVDLGDDALRYRSVFPYVLMLVVIAVRPQGLFGRTRAGCDADVMTSAARTPRCARACRRARPRCAGYPYAWLAIFVVFMIAAAVHPELGQRPDARSSTTWIFYTILVVGFYFVFGVSGQFAFSQAAFAMVGGYTSAWATREGVDWILAVAFGDRSCRA